jgi:hypothetical protein
MAPDQIELVYRRVGSTHVFMSRGITGLVHVGSHDRKSAFTGVIDALNFHVEQAYETPAVYEAGMSYEEFAMHVDTKDDLTGNFLTAKLLAA